MRYELEPEYVTTGNAILYQDVNCVPVTKNKAYLVIGQNKDIVTIINNNFIPSSSWGPGQGRRFIKEVSIEYAEPGDDIIFLRNMDYVNNKPLSGDPKKGEVFTITKIDGSTIYYGLYANTTVKMTELGVQKKDVIILKTIKDKKIQDYIVDISNTTVNERLELRDVMLYNLQNFDSILNENRIRGMDYASYKFLICKNNSWFGALTSQDKPNISCKDFIQKFKKKSDDEKQPTIRTNEYYNFFKKLYYSGIKIEWTNVSNEMHENNDWYDVDYEGFGNYKMANKFENQQHIVYRIKETEEIPSISENKELQTLWNSENKIKKQNKEAIMPFQDIINSIFGISAYDKKPKFLVTIYKPDGSECASATATSIDDIKQKAATDYRLIGHKIVVYKLHTEITAEIPVTITRLKDEKSKEPEIDKQ